MSCLIKLCLDGNSKGYEYNKAYIDIPLYDDEVVSLPDLICQIKTNNEKTNININQNLIRRYELLSDNARIKEKNNKSKTNFEINSDGSSKIILYPKDTVNYRGQEIDCYAVLIWHLDRNTLRIIDRSCRF